jgi:hypothetical protein
MSCIVTSVIAQNPTPEELVKNWATLSDNKEGKIVYMSHDTSKSDITVINLSTGIPQKIAEFPPANTVYGISGSVMWSPDGKRITMQNNLEVRVMNADGSNMKTIVVTQLEGDLIGNGWNGNDKVVYSIGDSILCTEISAQNEPIATEALVSAPPGGYTYSSVTMSGDYLAYIDNMGNWIPLNVGGHRPLVLNVKTGVLTDIVPRTSDGCQLRIKPDGSGTVMFCEQTHYRPATVKNIAGVVIDSIPIINDPVGNVCIQHMRWSSDTGFVTVMGCAREPLYAWIIRMSDKKWMYLGDAPYHPDLWINQVSAISPFSNAGPKPARVAVSIPHPGMLLVKVPAAGNSEITIFDCAGKAVFAGFTKGKSACVVTVNGLGSGMYVVTVRSGGVMRAAKIVLSGK